MNIQDDISNNSLCAELRFQHKQINKEAVGLMAQLSM